MKLLKKGLNSDIYEIDAHHILKLYNGWISREEVIYEFNTTKAAIKAGVPSVEAIELVNQEFRSGIIFKKIDGTNIEHKIIRQPWNIWYWSKQMAKFHLQLHSYQIPNLRSQKTLLTERIDKSHKFLKPYSHKIEDYKHQLWTDETALCHGDFSPPNIMVSNKKMIIIDWANASMGNPISDVVKASLIIRSPEQTHIPPIIRPFSQKARAIISQTYIKTYSKLNEIDDDVFSAWKVINAAARLAENVPEERDWLLDIIKNTHAKLG